MNDWTIYNDLQLMVVLGQWQDLARLADLNGFKDAARFWHLKLFALEQECIRRGIEIK